MCIRDRLGANLSNSNLHKANFSNSIMFLSSLENSDLSNARLHATNLSHANLNNANLTKAKFSARKVNNILVPQKHKSGISKKITIKEHERTMSQYVYGGVCKNCNDVFERLSFGSRFPVYCDYCAGLTPKEKLKYQKKSKPQKSLSRIK